MIFSFNLTEFASFIKFFKIGPEPKEPFMLMKVVLQIYYSDKKNIVRMIMLEFTLKIDFEL